MSNVVGKLVGSVLDAGGLPNRLVAAIALASGLGLLVPDPLLARIHVVELRNANAQWLGVALVVSCCLLIVSWVYALGGFTARAVRQGARSRRAVDQLRHLAPAEVPVLREFFLQGRDTIELPLDDPVVAGLIHRGLVMRVGTVGRASLAGMIFPVRLPDYVRAALPFTRLGIPLEPPSGAEREKLERERPGYLRTILSDESLRSGRF